ncbi:MAG: nuclear transport factor 2 family protein [Myxococcota bacterium]
MNAQERVTRFFDLVEARDFAAFRAAFAPNARIHQNGTPLGLDQLVQSTEAGSKSVRYLRRRSFAGEAAGVEQHDVEIELVSGETVLVRDVCVVFRFDSKGRIAEIDEYVTPQKPG